MMYAILGTNTNIRKKGFAKILGEREPSFYIRNDNLWELSPLIGAEDLFGGEIIVVLEQISQNAEGRKFLEDNFEALQESKNTFILDEPFSDANFSKKIIKNAKEVIDGREEKSKPEDAFELANAIGRKDKRGAWIEWKKIDHLAPELVVGTLWWKVRSMWEGVKGGRGNVYSEEDLSKLGFHLLKMGHDAHRGIGNLKEEIEKLILRI